MGRDRCVDPEPFRIPISDGDFIDVKTRLNHGEHEEYLVRLSPFHTHGETLRMERR